VNRLPKIFLLNPPFKKNFSRSQRSPGTTKAGTLYYPYWLASVTGLLEKEGFSVELCDAPADGLDEHRVYRRVDNFKPDLLIIDTSTPSIQNDICILERLKNSWPEVKTVMVGPHPSVLAEEILSNHRSVDFIARKEYDYTILELAKKMANDEDLTNIQGISFYNAGQVINNPDRPYIENMDELPMLSKVYKKHLNIKNYRFAAARYPMVMMITGRGCPFHCSFCLYPQTMHGRKYRLRTAENVIDEISFIVQDLPEVKEIVIEDDTFTAELARVRQICEMLIERNIRIPWSANARINLDYETMKLMRKAGCRLLIVGFESGNQSILNNVHKGITLEQSIQFMENAKKAGILVHACYMIGLPGETRETAKQTFQFAVKLASDSAQFFPLYVYPGTEAYLWAEKEGYLDTRDYSKWVDENGHHRCVTSLTDLSSQDADNMCISFYKKYHLNQKYLMKKILQLVTNPQEGWRSLRAAIWFLKYLLKRDRVRLVRMSY